MAKRKGMKEREESLQRKLVKAQSELQQAQARRAEAVARGEKDLEKVRQRSARRLAKATQRVERRAVAVSRLEARLLSFRAGEENRSLGPGPISVSPDAGGPDGTISTHEGRSVVTRADLDTPGEEGAPPS
jgi:hypothetical protein